jgi:tRNA nucleotidyltransferase (CCA-adding enzyme)
MHIDMPDSVKKIINTLYDNGYEAYIVGGCVRDSLSNRPVHDWDITTNAIPETVSVIFEPTHNVIPTGIKHGTVTIIGDSFYGYDNIPYEITTYRIDEQYSDGRHPDNVIFTKSLKEDLARRDFSINSMAYNDREGLIDPFNGQEDLQNKIIKCVGNPLDRFNEDALRMMRAVRFAAQLGFRIDSNTKNAIRALSDNIQKVSVERIREEFNKILLSDNPLEIYSLNWLGLMKHWLPEYDICEWTNQDNPYHVFSVGKHLIYSVQAIEKQLDLKLTMFLHDIAKPKCKTIGENGIGHFYNHAEESAEITFNILKRMKYDNQTIDKVVALIKYHDIEIQSKRQIRKLLNKIGEENFRDLLKIKEADYKAQNLQFYIERHTQLDGIENKLNEILREKDCFTLKDLKVNGYDIMNLGYRGREIGEVLNKLLEIVLEEPEKNDKENLLNIAKSMK